ncbi:MAG: hypothetical protein ACFB0G_06250 [Leptolyngbyaceae cyanobacterium]
MGGSILDGHLPYGEFWDLKPPIAFFSYSLFMMMFGQSITAVRFAGTLCVTAMAFCVFLTVVKRYGRKLGWVASLLSVFMVGQIPTGQATMSEIVALVPISVAFYWVVTNPKPGISKTFGIGALLAIASLIRLNLLYVSLGCGLLLLLVSWRQKLPLAVMFYQQSAYVLGHVTCFLLTIIPYAWAGKIGVWWRAVILAPVSYASAQVVNIQIPNWSLSWLLLAHTWGWLIPLFGLIYALVQVSKSPLSSPDHLGGVTLLFLATIALSMLRGGSLQNHYLIQLVPFLSILLVIMLATFKPDCKRLSLSTVGTMATTTVLFFSLTSSVIADYSDLLDKMDSPHGLLQSNLSYKTATYLIEHRRSDESVYMMTDHLVYWLINAPPITPCSTHPSNVVRASLLPFCSSDVAPTPQSEMNKILALKPDFIVKKSGIPWYLRNEKAVWSVFAHHLQEQYTLVAKQGTREIYQKT